jgi:hypothetical protein
LENFGIGLESIIVDLPYASVNSFDVKGAVD